MTTFGEVVEVSLGLLSRRGRVSHTALRLEFDLDDATFAALREELVTVLGAADDDGAVLVARHGVVAAQPAGPDPAPPVAAPPPAGEHGALSVLLCDLADTPALEALDGDARAVVCARFHEICGEVAARLRGHVLPWISDGVAVFFGHPHAQDDDALRAVRCAEEILRTLAAARDVIEREFGVAFSARLAIATGAAGDGADGTNSFGDIPRLAGALQERAAADRVTVDAATRAAASEGFDFAPVSGDDDAFVVTAARSGDMTARHAPPPLVGRTGERALLQALAERAAGGTRSAVLIRGEAGSGKTRLVAALVTRARDELGMAVLTCTCSPYHRGSALHPLLTGLRGLWELDGADASQRLSARAAGLAGGERAAALLAGLLGVALPGAGIALAGMSPVRRRRESLAALADALAFEARQAPLLVIAEDLHWADPSTLELLTVLLDAPRERPVMLALTARSEFAGPPTPSLQRIELPRLDAAESLRLVELVAAEGTLPDGIAAQLAERAGGSPLLAEELTRTALATQNAGPGSATLYGCLMARLDRDASARAVAQLAATIGREFDVSLLHAIGTIERSVLDWGLERLVQDDVIVPSGAGRYAFRHSLLQDAARSSQRKHALRGHNRGIARTLLARFPHVAAAEPERIARHLEYAGEVPEAVRHWHAAGEQALAQHALEEAAGHFMRAIELNARTPESAQRRATELALRVGAGQSIALRLGWSAAAATTQYARAEHLSATVDHTPELFDALAHLTAYRTAGGRIDAALDLARAQLAIAAAAADSNLLLEAERAYGGVLVHLGRHREALEHLARTTELYDGARHREHSDRFGANPATRALGHRAVALACRGDADGARYAITSAAELVRAEPHAYSEVWVHSDAAVAAHVAGARELVLHEAAAALQIAAEEGFDNRLGHAHALHGWARVAGGEHADGLAELRDGVALWATSGARVERPFLNGLLADALARIGEPEVAMAALAEALRWTEHGERWYEPELHRMRAELLLAAGDLPGAQRSAGAAMSLARRMGAGAWERRAAVTFARAGNGSALA